MQSKNQPIFVFDNSSSPDSLETLSNILMKPTMAGAKKEIVDSDLPKVHFIVIIDNPALFLEEFFQKIFGLDYPQELLSMSIVARNEKKKRFISAIKEDFKSKVSIVETISEALRCSQEDNNEGSFTFFIRSSAQLEVPSVLKDLITQNEKVLAPLLLTYSDTNVWTLVSPYDFGWASQGTDIQTPMQLIINKHDEDTNINTWKMFTMHNFNVDPRDLTLAYIFGPFGNEYEKEDFAGLTILEENDPRKPELQEMLETKRAKMIEKLPISVQIQENIRRSRSTSDLSRVLHVTHCYLVKSEILKDFTFPDNLEEGLEEDIWFSDELRKRLKIPLKVLHDKSYGQIVNTLGVDKNLENPELSRFFENHDLWQQRYIDPQMIKTYGKGNELFVEKPSESPLNLISETPCKDVYQVKLFKPLFAQHLLQEATRHDALFQPSNLHISVTNTVEVGNENWPQLLALHQIGLEREWMAIAKFYITYLVGNNMFKNDNVGPVHGKVSIVKHPSSTEEYLESEMIYKVKIILPLNEDYEGGGYKFIQQNCTVQEPPLGSILVHPGRLTHLAKELPVTNGAKYHLDYHMETFHRLTIGIYGESVIPGFTKEPAEGASREEKLKFLKLISPEEQTFP